MTELFSFTTVTAVLRLFFNNGVLPSCRFDLYGSRMPVNLGTAFDILIDSGVEIVGSDGDRVLLRTSRSRALRYKRPSAAARREG